VTVALAVLPLMGCANYIFRPFNIDGGNSISVDAKQRMVLVTHKGGKSGDRTVVCTEPSPDAISALALSGSANASATLPGTQGSGSAGGSFASSEAVASIAMRTQTIQLLRDGLFRACEAYMNGAIDQHQYNVVLLNIDRLMVTLLGVDAIGGMGMVAPVAIGATSSGVSAPAARAGTPAAAANSVQSEAMANIIMSANAHSSLPALCISLMASGELRLDNPGHHAVLARCDYLLAGTMNNIVNRPPAPPPQFKASRPPPLAAAPPQPAAAPPQQKKVAGWLTRLDKPAGGWDASVVQTPTVPVATANSSPYPTPGKVPGWSTQVNRNAAEQ
jgi:hypothetical protein